MSAAIKIAKWVQKKPMILIRFDEMYSNSLHNSRQGFEHLTIAKPHSFFEDFKLPTACLLEIQERNKTQCYWATATRKTVISLFDSRLTIKKLRAVKPSSFRKIERMVPEAQMRRLLSDRLPTEGGFSMLSPKLSAHLIEVLSNASENHSALDTVLLLL